jgi:hypothetical protein
MTVGRLMSQLLLFDPNQELDGWACGQAAGALPRRSTPGEPTLMRDHHGDPVIVMDLEDEHYQLKWHYRRFEKVP